MITYNDLVNKLAEINYFAACYLSNSARGNAERLHYKIQEINIMLDKLWEKETEEANERQEQAN
jgi:hypothetical protein